MKNKYGSLLDYLKRKEAGGFGWKSKYMDDLHVKESGYPWLAGFTESMLDDLIGIVGLDRCITIVQQFNELESKGHDST